VNVGLPILTCDTSRINESDELHVDLLDGVLVNRTTDDELAIDPLPPVMMQLLRDGGLKAHVQTHGALELD
jgi:3-isopropylmalate/(R)-2-methylmalate dehydratase small subunit